MLGLLIVPVYAFLSAGAAEGFKTIPVVLVIVLFYFLKLTTSIDESGIRMFFFPFVRKTVSWSEIKSTKVFDYGFVGGW